MEEMRDCVVGFRIVVGKHLGERPLERRRCRWDDNIKMDLKEMQCVDCIQVTHTRIQVRAIVYTVMFLD
jgi:hypothetical protein